MPQVFQVLKCYKCFVFQIHQTRKSNKFECKMCGEKQSIKRHYGIGTSKDCRLHVQQLNGIRGDMDMNYTIQIDSEEFDDSGPIEQMSENSKTSVINQPKRSKWSAFIDAQQETAGPVNGTEEPMFLGDREVFLELPQKSKCKNVKVKTNYSANLEKTITISADISNTELQINRLGDTNKSDKLNSDVNFKSFPNLNESCGNRSVIVHNKSLIMNNNDISTKEPPTRKDITLNKSSKWAQFVDAEECSQNIENDDPSSSYEYVESIKKATNLYSLCDDNDLDTVLDI